MESIWKMLTGRNFLNSWNELPRRCLWSFQSLPEGPTNELSNDRHDFIKLAAALPATAAGSWAMAQAHSTGRWRARSAGALAEPEVAALARYVLTASGAEKSDRC